MTNLELTSARDTIEQRRRGRGLTWMLLRLQIRHQLLQPRKGAEHHVPRITLPVDRSCARRKLSAEQQQSTYAEWAAAAVGDVPSTTLLNKSRQRREKISAPPTH